MHEPGWEVLEGQDLLAFKAPVPVPSFMNFVYGNVTLAKLRQVKNFYENKSFFWLLQEGQNAQLLIEQGFTLSDSIFEMGIHLAEYRAYAPSAGLEIREVRSSEDYLKWVDVASGWLRIDSLFVDQFFAPWIKMGKYLPYLGFCDGKPAGTSLVYCGNLGAAIYCLGTLPFFRNRGLGTALTHVCLKAAKDRNINQVVLYGSEMGKQVYAKIGFRHVQTLREYSFNPT